APPPHHPRAPAPLRLALGGSSQEHEPIPARREGRFFAPTGIVAPVRCAYPGAEQPFLSPGAAPMFPHVPRLRRLAGCLLLVTFIAVVLACGGGGSLSKKVGSVKRNETLVFNDSTWVVLEAKDLGKVLKPTEAGDEERKTEGRFILVRYKITNTSKKVVWLPEADPPLVDDK